jgi:hypothetical protein
VELRETSAYFEFGDCHAELKEGGDPKP